MNRKQVEQWAGSTVYLICWPFTGSVNTAEGKQFGPNYNVAKEWLLLKLTKGGLAMLTDGENTISVPPFYVNDRITLK